MDMAGQIENKLVLVANPGSASRKYALLTSGLVERAQLHFEVENDKLVCTLHNENNVKSIAIDFDQLPEAAAHVEDILRQEKFLAEGETIDFIGLRIVAPSGFFMQDHIMTDDIVERLQSLLATAPIHINATLSELKLLKSHYSNVVIVGVSDSAFHATKPNYAWNYGINIHDADRLDIKRFGYHGISTSASINALWDSGKLAPKVIVCHLGGGSSVTGVFHGRSIDTTMGYTPLDGVIMATRSGSIDYGAVRALKLGLDLNDEQLEDYLHTKSGLLGLGQSNDIRVLIEREAEGDHFAHLALTTLVHTFHKAIGAMIVALGGADLIVFTGTVGERSAILRKRIISHLEFMDFIIDGDTNDVCTAPQKMTIISQNGKSRPIIVIPTNESLEIVKHVLNLTK